MALLFALLLLMAQGPQLIVHSRVIPHGGAVNITCRIPRKPENRSVSFGLEGRLTTLSVDGERSPTVYTKTIQNIDDCPAIAVCGLTDNTGKYTAHTLRLMVMGCDNPEDDALN